MVQEHRQKQIATIMLSAGTVGGSSALCFSPSVRTPQLWAMGTTRAVHIVSRGVKAEKRVCARLSPGPCRRGVVFGRDDQRLGRRVDHSHLPGQ